MYLAVAGDVDLTCVYECNEQQAVFLEKTCKMYVKPDYWDSLTCDFWKMYAISYKGVSIAHAKAIFLEAFCR